MKTDCANLAKVYALLLNRFASWCNTNQILYAKSCNSLLHGKFGAKFDEVSVHVHINIGYTLLTFYHTENRFYRTQY